MKSTAACVRARFSFLLTFTALVAGCDDDGGSGRLGLLEFTDPSSDVALVYPRGDETMVLLRGESSERAWYLELVHADGTTTEIVQDAHGRLVELGILQHRFVLSDYTATDVAITHYGPDGGETTERVPLVDPNTAPVGAKQLALDSDGNGDAEVSKQLQWFADPSNYQLTLKWIRDGVEYGAEKLKAAQDEIKQFQERAGLLTEKVGNELTCLTATRRLCAEQVARESPAVMRELRTIDPQGTTTAGFNVSDRGIELKRDEWEVEAQQRTVPLGFTLTDVPCEESAFADMNPECPQYVPPPSATPGADGGVPVGDAGGPGTDAGAPGSDAGIPDPDASVPGDAGTPGNGPTPDDPSCRSVKLQDGYSWQCKTWRESYSQTGDTAHYGQYRNTNGLMEDSVGLATREGKAFRYAAHNYDYDAARSLLREELMISDTLEGYSQHFVTTPEGGGWFRTETHECWNTYHKYTVSRGGNNPITMPRMVISQVVDSNFEKCPTSDRVEALAAAIFPDLPLTESVMYQSRAYMLYTAAQ